MLGHTPVIWQLISEFLPTKEAVTLRLVSKANADYLRISSSTRPSKLVIPVMSHLTELDLSHCCTPMELGLLPRLSKLNITNNLSITHCNIPSLRELIAASSDVNPSSLEGLNLLTLDIHCCDIGSLPPLPCLTYLDARVTDIGDKDIEASLHLQTLKVAWVKGVSKLPFANLTSLDISYVSGVTERSLAQLPNPQLLTELDVTGNAWVSNVSYLPNLRKLYIGNSGVTQSGIQGLVEVTELSVTDNQDIVDLTHMSKLTKLDISRSGVSQAGIAGLCQVEELRAIDCSTIHDISAMSKLRIIHASGCGIDQQGIRGLTEVQQIHLRGNHTIFDLSHMTNLTIANISYTRVTQQGVEGLTKLVELYMSNTSLISDLSHCQNLTMLDASESSIGQETIDKLHNLGILYAYDNPNIVRSNAVVFRQ